MKKETETKNFAVFNDVKARKDNMKNTIIILCFTVFCSLPIIHADAGEYLNQQLPEWLNVDLQLRHRYERRSDFDFNHTLDDNDGFNLWRGRLGIMLKPADQLKIFYQFQDARLSDYDLAGPKTAFEDWAENRQLWLEAQTDQLKIDSIGLNGMGVKIGRQELSYGSQRLIGPVNWSNVGQTFDAGKVSLLFNDVNLNLDIFDGEKTPIKSPREQNDFLDGSSNDRLAGYYAVYKGISHLTIDQYLLNRNTEGKRVSFGQTGDGEVDDYTFGFRLKGQFTEIPVDYELEAAKQFGKSGSLDVDAQMVVATLGYTFKHSWKPRFALGFDYASGDNHKSDSERNTFDNLYPTNHQFYGYMDFVSLQNINNYRFQFTVFPAKKLELEADLHLIFLDTPKDNLYGANQSVKRSTTPGASTHVGNEIDLLGKYKVCSFAEIMFGYSHLFAGDFLKSTGKSDDADFVYVQTTLNF